MPYIIQDIRSVQPEPNKVYLFDTNIWLAVLESYYNNQQYSPYIKFFGQISDLNNGSRIAVVGVLISEIINRVIRDIYLWDYCQEFSFDYNTIDFKKDYKSSTSYSTDMISVCTSISAYHQHMLFISDNLNQYSTKKLLRNIPASLDFNDHMLVKIAQEQSLTIVTHDKDFSVENVEILTVSKELLNISNVQNTQ